MVRDAVCLRVWRGIYSGCGGSLSTELLGACCNRHSRAYNLTYDITSPHQRVPREPTMEARRPRGQAALKKLGPLLITTLIGLAILCNLGFWQLRRLDEKTKLIATLEERLTLPPILLFDAIVRVRKGEDLEYMPITTEGRVDPTHALAKVTSFQSKPGWQIIEPFVSLSGEFVLIDAGASSEKTFLALSSSNEAVNGIIRLHRKGKGYFDNDNDVKGNTWYWWDLPAMQKAAGLNEDTFAAPFVIQKIHSDSPGMPPFPQPVKVELSNNHLGYAITWFGLAAALLGVAGFFVLDQHKRES
jgi:surfeit locus 1 family protein